MTQAYTCSWTKAVHSLKNSSFVMLLEAPQIWRMKRYNVLETELVYSFSIIIKDDFQKGIKFDLLYWFWSSIERLWECKVCASTIQQQHQQPIETDTSHTCGFPGWLGDWVLIHVSEERHDICIPWMVSISMAIVDTLILSTIKKKKKKKKNLILI